MHLSDEFTANIILYPLYLNHERGLAIKNQGNLIYSYEELPYILEDKKLIINSLLAKPINGFSVNNVIDFNSREIPAYNSKLDTL